MKKYYIVQSDNYAKTIHFLSGIPYYTFPDKKNDGGIVYSFENSEKLQEVLSLINKTTKKIQKYIKNKEN